MKLRAGFAGLAFACAIAAVAVHTASRVDDPEHPGRDWAAMADFRGALYYPLTMLLAGRNPYEPVDDPNAFPSRRGAPLYLPMSFVVHLPLGFLSRHRAEAAYFLLNVLLAVAMAYLALRLCRLRPDIASVLGVGTLLVLSRPGEFGLFAGQSTFSAATGIYLAFLFATARPWLAGLGLALACLKPTFGLPLGVLMLCRGNVRAVAVGGVVVAALNACALVPLAGVAGGLGALLASLHGPLDERALRPDVSPVLSPYRIDAASTLGRLFGWPSGTLGEVVVAAAVFSAGAVMCRRLARTAGEEHDQFATTLGCLLLVVSVYHQTYDALVLLAPFVALASGRWRPPGAPSSATPRWPMLGLLAVPALNYGTIAPVVHALADDGLLRRAVFGANGAALLAALLWHLRLAGRSERSPPGAI